MLRVKHDADKIDICVVCDKDNPAGNRGDKDITPLTYRKHLMELMPLVYTCPCVRSLYEFDSRRDYWAFIRLNLFKYKMYPSIWSQLAETHNFYGGATYKEVQGFYRERGFIPYLTIDDYHLNWARNFYKTKAKGLLPVVVSLRGNPRLGIHRNAERNVWLTFFDLCKSAFPDVIFVVIGSQEESFKKLRHRSNVMVAKDYGSSLLDDLALIRTSLLYMGVESGIVNIAFFSAIPYLIFGREKMANEALKLKAGSNFEFATRHQKVFSDSSFTITPESLLKEFTDLYQQLDRESDNKHYRRQ